MPPAREPPGIAAPMPPPFEAAGDELVAEEPPHHCGAAGRASARPAITHRQGTKNLCSMKELRCRVAAKGLASAGSQHGWQAYRESGLPQRDGAGFPGGKPDDGKCLLEQV